MARENHTFDPARERALRRLVARSLARDPAAPPDDVAAELEDFASAAAAIAAGDLAEASCADQTVDWGSRALAVACALRPATARTIEKKMRERVMGRATGLGAYASGLTNASERMRFAIKQSDLWTPLRDHAPHLLAGVALEAFETVVARDPALELDSPRVHSNARPGTVTEVQAAASVALASDLDTTDIEEWAAERAPDADTCGLPDEGLPETHLSSLLDHLYWLGCGDPAELAHHVPAFRAALSALELFGDEPLPAIISAAANAIDGSGLGGGAAPWITTSVEKSMSDATWTVRQLGALRQGDEHAASLMIVTDCFTRIAQRELVLLWWISDVQADS